MNTTKRKIDLLTYPRRDLFYAFKDRAMPCFSTVCNVKITHLLEFKKQHNVKTFITLTYLISKTVNAISQLRHRIIEGELYEYDRVDPGYTVFLSDETFSFCDSIYQSNFRDFHADNERRIEAVHINPDVTTGEKHHMFFISNVPWFSFTSFTHPYHEQYASLPIITIGKFFEQNGEMFMPLGIQVHHGVVDGFHVGQFYDQLSTAIDVFEG